MVRQRHVGAVVAAVIVLVVTSIVGVRASMTVLGTPWTDT